LVKRVAATSTKATNFHQIGRVQRLLKMSSE
jgi:hypothetical protein